MGSIQVGCLSDGEVGCRIDGLERKHVKPGKTMRILLQHTRTGLYLKGLGNWTANPYEALDFQHSQRAIDFARQHRLGGVQIAVRFIDNDYDEVAQLPPIEGPQPVYR